MDVDTQLNAPAFLIAVPQLGDPNFNRGVVLLLEHGERGTMGLVINRPTGLKIGEFCQSQELTYKGDTTSQVYQGGPVQTERAFILHAKGVEGPETEEIGQGISLSYSLDSLKKIASKPPDRVRVYLGYAGWGPDQLTEELSQGAWLIAPADMDLVFDVTVEKIWEAALRSLGISPAQLLHSGSMH